MNSFYSTLYGKFAELQVDPSFSVRYVYPSSRLAPSLKLGKEISDCVVRIPAVQTSEGMISYGQFQLKDSEYNQVSAVKLALASTCLLSAKSIFNWLYQEYIQHWVESNDDKIKAAYTIHAILDMLARQRIRQVEGEDFYTEVICSSDLLASKLLPHNVKDFGTIAEAALTSVLINVPTIAPTTILKSAQNFAARLTTLAFDPSRIINTLRESFSRSNNVTISRSESGWDTIAKLSDSLYPIIDKLPGKWHSLYLPHSNPLDPTRFDSIFKGNVITVSSPNKEDTLEKDQVTNNGLWLDVYFELMREANRNEKIKRALSRATKDLNFGDIGIPVSDYLSYHKVYTELAPQIRQIIDRVSLIKNVLDENAFEESGNIDLQAAIQAIASETPRNDIFIKDENLLKNESWTILIDSSLSLSGSSKELKAISICLAETARQIMGSIPWAMFAFSDEFYCVKDYTEPYDNQIKARIGGLTQKGLSYIPDAIRTCRNLIAEHSQDRNYLILVSDGIPSGYQSIESEFAVSVKELGRHGINLAAVALGSASIKKVIHNARIVNSPTDMAKEFIQIYQTLSF